MATSMVKGNPMKLMLQFAFPLLIGNLLQQTYNIIDAAIVGQTLGPEALASVGASSSVQFLVLGFCMGSCTGFSVPVAKYFGAGKLDKMRDYIFNGAALAVLIAAILTTLCSLLTDSAPAVGSVRYLRGCLRISACDFPRDSVFDSVQLSFQHPACRRGQPHAVSISGIFGNPEYFPRSVLYYHSASGMRRRGDCNDFRPGDQRTLMSVFYFP